MRKTFVFIIALITATTAVYAQKPQKLNSNEIYEKIQKLNFLGTALYIAAHPDDENTRLISYLANNVKARTGYLSLTRGDGGQNLIGPEIRELLGVIRTKELLAARNVDGGEQLFTRANDFGYSKHPEETLEIWDKEKVLSDVVWAIRKFKPDVIINRFNHRTPGTTHGHHTSSAMLSVEAFDLANDKTKYTSQLNYVDAWQPKRLFFNTSWWFYGSQEKFEAATKDNPKFVNLDVGVYYPLKGLSNNEIAALASSQHLCQGFGRLTTRGSQPEYLEFLKGDEPKDKEDVFAGINTTWNRIEGGGAIGDILYEIEENFDFNNPGKHIPKLMEAYYLIKDLKDKHWKTIKEKQIKELIQACAGLYLEASAESATAIPNSEIEISFEAINRSDVSMELTSITTKLDAKNYFKQANLSNNKKYTYKHTMKVNATSFSSPYWLKNDWELGMYTVNEQELIGLPENPEATQVEFNMIINNLPITFTKNIIRRYSERDKGEIYEPFAVLPKITSKIENKVIIFSDTIAKDVVVSLRSGANYINGSVSLEVPEGWQVSPAFIPFGIEQKNDIQNVTFSVKPPVNASEGQLQVVAKVQDKEYRKELVEINYNHIPKQTVLLNSQAKVVRLNIQKSGNNIGYIKGAGDAIPESLRQIGYEVSILDPTEINSENISEYDAIVLGIRAYNVVKELKFKQRFLLDYVKKGGTLIVQYNTNRGVDVAAPFPLQLSRDRVTDENSNVLILKPEHELLNYPNAITEKDFEGWVQERGLYFPNKWSEEYTPLLMMYDKGDTPKNGSLLIAKYGEGNYIYTGLSFFRELPAGVSGAYKLFANLLSVGNQAKEGDNNQK